MSMKALVCDKPGSFAISDVPIPQINDEQVLVKVTYCGVCGSDELIVNQGLIASFPRIPGHEVVGLIAEVGKNVKSIKKGDRCVADNTHPCHLCFYCRRGNHVMCENLVINGCTLEGGFAEYVAYPENMIHKITNLADADATLVEPAACATHGMDRLHAALPGGASGLEVLLFGAGPSGLLLAKLLRVNGATRVVVAANAGPKTRIAKETGAADEVFEVDREAPDEHWRRLKAENPHGFDVVVEATGSEKLANESLDYVRRGGVLMLYGLYASSASAHWPPSKIFGDEIQIIGTFAQSHCFPRAVAYLDSGKVDVKGMVTDVFPLTDFKAAMDKLRSRSALKIAIQVSVP